MTISKQEEDRWLRKDDVEYDIIILFTSQDGRSTELSSFTDVCFYFGFFEDVIILVC